MKTIKIDGEIGWDVTATSVEAQLQDASGDIEIVIDSPGGSVIEGVKIYNLLHKHEGQKIVTINSIAASMATYIAMVGDHVRTYDNATFMIHNAWGFAMGDHRVMRDTAEVLEGLSNLIAKKYVQKTKKSPDEIAKMMDEETFLFGEEIKAHGFADEVISTDDKPDRQASIALASERYKACLQKMRQQEIDLSKEEVAALLRHTDDGGRRRALEAKLRYLELGGKKWI